MIWERSLQPRVLTIDNVAGFYSLRSDYEITAKHPAILRVSKEARAAGLKHYKPCFSSLNGRPTYFNFSKDIIHINFEPFHDFSPPEFKEEFKEVRYLVYSGLLMGYECMVNNPNQLRHFNQLKVYVVVSSEIHVIRAAMAWVRETNEKKILNDTEASLSKVVEVQGLAVCFRSRTGLRSLIMDPDEQEKVVNTPMFRRSLV